MQHEQPVVTLHVRLTPGERSLRCIVESATVGSLVNCCVIVYSDTVQDIAALNEQMTVCVSGYIKQQQRLTRETLIHGGVGAYHLH